MSEPANRSVSVLVTSFRRLEYLRRCLDSLANQTLPPAQIVVTARDSDVDTQELVRRFGREHPQLRVDLALASQPGVVPANNAAIPLLTGEIVAFLDDDSDAPPEWLARLARHYTDPTVGAVGGRILNHRDGKLLYGDAVFAAKSCRIDRWGTVWPGQMYPFSGLIEVDHLAGGNMSLRGNLLVECDGNLLGDGFRYETDLSLTVKAAGFRVLLDSEAVNSHWCAPRQDGPDRGQAGWGVYCNQHNHAYVLAKHRAHAFAYMVCQLLWRFPRAFVARMLGRGEFVCYAKGTLAGFLHGLRRGRKRLREHLAIIAKRGSD